MQTTLQDQYKLITEGKGHKDVFLKNAIRLFPQHVTNQATFEEVTTILKQKSILTEHNIGGVVTTSPNKQPDWFKIFNENIEDPNGSDGDYEFYKDTQSEAESLYDQGQELYNQGKTDEAEELRQQALKIGSTLSWTSFDLPPYTNWDESDDLDPAGGSRGLEGYAENINESKEVDMSKPFAMVQDGGSIGDKRGIIYTFDTKEEGLATAKRWNDQRTPGEKSYYKIKYKIIPTPKNLNEVKEELKPTKIDNKETDKDIVASQSKNYDYKTKENRDNVFGQEFLNGYYTELRDPKNIDKTEEELKDIVTKNLTKDSLFYVKNGQFGTKGIGYSEETPGIKKSVEAKGKFKSSGYGDLEDKKSTIEKSNTKSTLGDQEANTKMPSKVKEMETKSQSSKGVQKMKNTETKWKIVKINEETSPLISNKQKEDQLTKLMSKYDWYYEMSDDLKKGEQGQLIHDKIMKLVDELGDKGKDIFNLFAPKDRSLKESKLRNAIKQIIKEELDLKEIDTLGEDAGKIAKIRKIDEEISKRSKKLKALNTLKELEDDAINPTKIKELNNEIKKLTQLKEKLSKSKSSKEEIVVDETKDKKMKPKSIKEDDSAIDKQIKDMSIKLAQLKKSKADADLNAATK